jgi:cytochrome c-550 PedF
LYLLAIWPVVLAGYRSVELDDLGAKRMTFRKLVVATGLGATMMVSAFGSALVAEAHGDVTPQQVDVSGLDPLGADLKKENPYRGNARALEVGTSGYAQNCARCHGLQVISGGLSPDLRYLEEGKVGDEWFMERVRLGARKPDGTTIMPAFEGLLQQEAMWAIRTYVESKREK